MKRSLKLHHKIGFETSRKGVTKTLAKNENCHNSVAYSVPYSVACSVESRPNFGPNHNRTSRPKHSRTQPRNFSLFRSRIRSWIGPNSGPDPDSKTRNFTPFSFQTLSTFGKRKIHVMQYISSHKRGSRFKFIQTFLNISKQLHFKVIHRIIYKT